MAPKWSLRVYDDPILRKKSEPIEEITDKIKELARFMIDYADNNNGIGLAAIQIGVPVRMFVLRDYIVDEEGNYSLSAPKVFINPKVVWKSEETDIDTEACLSIPGLNFGPVERPVRVKIEALDLDGNTFIDEREGLNARVTFHENDHLNGVLFIDRLPKNVRRKVEPQLQALKKTFN